jgi:FkbM family methyltransferase
VYWKIAGRKWLEDRRRELDFHRSLLKGFRPGDLIFDVGANIGSKTDVFLRMGARVASIEPDAGNQTLIREKYLRLRLRPKPLVVVGKAVSDVSATRTMLVDGPGSAVNTLSAKWAETLKGHKERLGTSDALRFESTVTVETVTLDELIKEHGRPFFIKIDVEGHESSALRGLHVAVPYVSFEVNLPEFGPEGLECVETLTRLDPDGRFNFTVNSGLKLIFDDWKPASEIVPLLEDGSQRSVEIFWRSTPR